MEGRVKFMGSTFGEIGFEAQFTTDSVGPMAFDSSFDDDQHSCSYVY